MADTPEKEPQAEAVNKEPQPDQQPVAPNRRSGWMWALAASIPTLVFVGAAAIQVAPEFNIALPNFSSVAELFPRAAATAPQPDPVTVALADIQASQQRNGDALQENGAVLRQNTTILQQGGATLDSLRQASAAQQANLKAISNQLAAVIARVDSLQNAVSPLTTSSIPHPSARAQLARTLRKTITRLPNGPVGPVSVGGAPLAPAPAPVLARDRFSAG